MMESRPALLPWGGILAIAQVGTNVARSALGVLQGVAGDQVLGGRLVHHIGAPP